MGTRIDQRSLHQPGTRQGTYSLEGAVFAGAGQLSGRPGPLTFGRGADVGGRASRDGSSVAFSAVDESLNLEELPFDAEAGRATGPARALTSGNNRVGFFDPAPDGKAIVFAAERGDRSHLWRIDPPAAGVELTRDPEHSDTGPVWSPDGDEIAFSRGVGGPGEGSQALWIIGADGTRPRRVTDFTGKMTWLPDGKALVQRGETLCESISPPAPRCRRRA